MTDNADLIALLNRSVFTGLPNRPITGRLVNPDGPEAAAAIASLTARVAELEAIINTPETEAFIDGVKNEAAHQLDRWKADHDAGKSPFDWFWLIGYLAQKAASSAVAGDANKAKHHTISTAAALANWHRTLSGGGNEMRPGIAAPALKATQP